MLPEVYSIPPEHLRLHLCYRYHAWDDHDYDPEAIWSFIQRHEGHISVQAAGTIDFYLSPKYHVLFTIAFPALRRVTANDWL